MLDRLLNVFFKTTSVFLLLLLAACVTESNVISGAKSDKTIDDKANNSAQRAISYMELDRFETAETILIDALKETPDHSILNYTFALLKLRLDESKAADKYFQKSVQSNPKHSRAAHDYGYYLCQTKNYEKALEMFDLAISNPLFTNKALSSLRAGECVFTLDKVRSEQYLLSAYNADTRLNVALYRLAELHYSKGTALKARAFYERYAAVSTESAASLYLAYRIEKLSGASKQEALYRTQLLKKYPGSKEASKIREKRKKDY